MPAAAAAPRRAAAPLPDFSQVGRGRAQADEQHPPQDRRAPRRTRGTPIPHVTQHDKADITALEALRKQYGPQAEKAGGKLTITAIALKIVAAALQQVPAVQRVDRHRAQRDRLQEVRPHRRRGRHRARPARAGHPRRRSEEHRRARRRAGAGVREGARRQAVARRDAGRRASRSPTSAASAARRSRRSSTGPRWRSSASRAARCEPVCERRAFEPRLMLPLSLSYDHRVIDGADARRASCAGSSRRSSSRSVLAL